MKNWYASRTFWAAIIGMIAMALPLLTGGHVTLPDNEQAQLVDNIINLVNAIIPIVSFLFIIIRKILDYKKENKEVKNEG